MSRRYRFISDPGHGWLEVPIEELKALSIEHLISSCSYTNGAFVYLEEDCDLSVYLTAKFGRVQADATKILCTRFWAEQTEQVHQERTFIRGLPCYPKADGYNFKEAMAYCRPPQEATI